MSPTPAIPEKTGFNNHPFLCRTMCIEPGGGSVPWGKATGPWSGPHICI